MDAADREHLGSRELIRLALETTAVPGAPPPLSRDEAAVGLGYLDIALRQNHVRRITERLNIVEHGAATSTTEIDVSLGSLDQEQREVCELFRSANRRSSPPGSQLAAGTASPLIWVPIARLSRRVNTPIDVRDREQAKVPRLTQLEVATHVAAGTYQLLRAILLSHPDSRKNNTDLGRLLYRVDKSRWLLQSAIRSLFVSRSNPVPLDPPSGTYRTRPGDAQAYRKFAIGTLEKYDAELGAFYDLMNVALNDYVLVVGLHEGEDDHLLTYDVPLEISQPPQPYDLRSFFSRKRAAYRVDYTTHVPTSLRAYHLVAETDPELHIESMFIASDADEPWSAEIAADLTFLGKRIEANRTKGPDSVNEKILEQELQVACGRLSELFRRRLWEAGPDLGAKLQSIAPNVSELARIVASGEVPESEGDQKASLLHHDGVTSAVLASCASELTGLELGGDFFSENDPAASRAHVYWRRYEQPAVRSQRTEIRASLVITDATAVRPWAVLRYVLAVLTVSVAVAILLAGSWHPFVKGAELRFTGLNDSIVAVLLLIPGFLFTRLDLPHQNTVAARVSVIPRLAAQTAVIVAICEAAVIATNAPRSFITTAWAVGTLVLLFSCAVLARIAMGHSRYSSVPQIGPDWIRRIVDTQPVPVAMKLFASGVDNG